MDRRSAHRDQRPGYARLLDAWVPPEGAGDPVGVVTTTFTFDSAFFEEECLARFLGMESDPKEDGPIYLIEREEKLAGTRCAAVLVDQHHCRGTRSLRWDLLPVRVEGGGVMHAKVSLLCWSQLIRVIVASANMTADGYRRNQEIFGVLEFSPARGEDPALLEAFTTFLHSMVANGGDTGVMPGAERLFGLLAHVEGFRAELPAVESDNRRTPVDVVPVFSGPGREDVFTQLKGQWPENQLPSVAAVTSPFFDPPEVANRPALRLWELMRPRSDADVTFNVVAEEIPGESAFAINAPRSLLEAQPAGRQTVTTRFRRLATQDQLDDSKRMFRPLHLKSLWLEGARWAAYLIGSSNFTSAGNGLSRSPNVEANLLYRFRIDMEDKVTKAMASAYLEGEELPDDIELRWAPMVDDDLAEAEILEVLPRGFIAAIYASSAKGEATIELHLAAKGMPASWSVTEPLLNKIILKSRAWEARGKQAIVRIPWPDLMPPSGFEVEWPGSKGLAWLPVIVKDATSLPPPSELKDLPLEVLIQVLTSSRPLYEVMRRWLKHRSNYNHDGPEILDTDPHGRVDTSTFLLQRTRRLAWALEALKTRLARPAATREALNWRLRGPVGVQILAEAIVREAVSDPERGFLTSELALALAQVKPCEAPGCLPSEEVRDEIRSVIRELRDGVQLKKADGIDNLAQYMKKVFSAALS